MKPRFFSLIFLILILLPVFTGCQAAKKPATPGRPGTGAPAALLDAAGKDTYTDGCVSCHKKTAEADRSLPAYVKRIAGHPEVKETSVSACYACHEAEKNYTLYRRFYKSIHLSHWKSDKFFTKLRGQCYSCHTVESNGVSGIKTYPLAGYRSGITGTAAKSIQPGPVQPPRTDTKRTETGQTETRQTETRQEAGRQSVPPKQQPEQTRIDNSITEEDSMPTPTP